MAKTIKPKIVVVEKVQKKSVAKEIETTKKVAPRKKGEINVVAELKGKTKVPKTFKQYTSYNKKFFVYLNLGPSEEFDSEETLIPKKFFTDENMAGHILSLGEFLFAFCFKWFRFISIVGR